MTPAGVPVADMLIGQRYDVTTASGTVFRRARFVRHEAGGVWIEPQVSHARVFVPFNEVVRVEESIGA